MSEFTGSSQWVRTRPGQLVGSEGWGASRAARAVGMTTADGRRVHTKWRDGVVVGAEPARSRCECPGVPGPHRTAREPTPSAAGGRCETRAFANSTISKPALSQRRIAGCTPSPRQQHFLPSHHSSLPGVARVPDFSCPSIGCTPGDWDLASTRTQSNQAQCR